MKQQQPFLLLFIAAATMLLVSCGPSIKTTASWVNTEKVPAGPVKSIFIIALTENMEAKLTLERDIAAAAEARGIKAIKSIDAMGPVGIKNIAPHKEAFEKKLAELDCQTIFTIALVNKESETRYVSGTTYTPYAYGGYGGYGGYGAYGPYGGFGGYYGYTASVMSSPGYYSTSSTYFIEAKLFDVKTEELLLSIQSKAANPGKIESASKMYTQSLVNELKELGLKRK
jgi:hypothetical protein